MNFLLIHNPTAYFGRNESKFEKVVSLFKEKELSFDYVSTTRKDEAIKLSREATKDRYGVVVPVGGDGTICEVITGLMSQQKKNRPRLGVLHIGTSPDFNRYHDIPINLEEAVNILSKGRTKRIDVGKITYLDLNKNRVTSYFGSSVNIGLGPDIASKSNGRYREYLGDFLGTFCSTLVSLVKFKQITLKFKIDGKDEKEITSLVNLTVGKDPYLASGMRVPIDIKPDDGKLYSLAIRGESKLSLLKNLWRLYSGNILDYDGANLRYCKNVEIESTENHKLEFDGDFRGYSPAKIEVIPRGLELIVK